MGYILKRRLNRNVLLSKAFPEAKLLRYIMYPLITKNMCTPAAPKPNKYASFAKSAIAYDGLKS